MNDWFVIITNPQCERKAAGELRRAGLRVYLPRETKEVSRRGVHRIVRRPLITGYLFIRFPDRLVDYRGVPHFAVARSCQGVKDFIRAMNDREEWEPFPIPQRMVGAIMRRERGREFDDMKVQQSRRKAQRSQILRLIKSGAKVHVSRGVFAGFTATIKKLAKGDGIAAAVDIFGRETLIRFSEPEEAFDPLDLARAAA